MRSNAARCRVAMVSIWRIIIGVILDGVGQKYAILTVAIVLLTTALHPLTVKVRRRKDSPRSGTLRVLSDPGGAKFEFVDSARPS